jgi:hypothetical protein
MTSDSHADDDLVMNVGKDSLNHDSFAGIFMIILGTLTFVSSPGWHSRAWLFPNLIGTAALIVGASLLSVAILRGRHEQIFASLRAILDAGLFLAFLGGYLFLLPRIGYVFSTALFVGLLMLTLAGRRPWHLRLLMLLGGATVASVLYLIFGVVLRVPLP